MNAYTFIPVLVGSLFVCGVFLFAQHTVNKQQKREREEQDNSD